MKKNTHFLTGEKQAIPWYIPMMFDSFDSEDWLKIIAFLQERGGDINAMNMSDETILFHFISNFPKIMGYFWLPVDVDDYENAEKKFWKACVGLDTLLGMGVDPNIPCGRSKQTALHYFIQKIDVKFIEGASEHIIQCFIDHGADINAADAYGYTPLHAAVICGDSRAVKYLLAKKARHDVTTNTGLTPLHLAAAGSAETTQMLIESGADVNALDKKGRTPLAFSEAVRIEKSKKPGFKT